MSAPGPGDSVYRRRVGRAARASTIGVALSTAALATVGAVATGCEVAPRALDWVLAFDEAEDEAHTSAVEVCIVEGECPEAPLRCDQGARVRYRETFGYGAGDVVVPADATRPPQLARGRYAFVARARDEDCAVLATGCVALDLPGPTEARIELASATRVAADCCGATCAEGLCRTGDAGPACEDDGDPCTDVGCDALGQCVTIAVPDGAPCDGGAIGACNGWVCMDGACVAAPFVDGTACVGSGAACTRGECRAGTCADVPLDDGTACAGNTGTCIERSVCIGGTCTDRLLPNGTPCAGADADPCHDPVCVNGFCLEWLEVPNGTPCVADAEECTSDSCQNGICTAIAVPNATRCGAGRYRDRCCGGRCVDIESDERNCGGCGLACRGGRCQRFAAERDIACTCSMGADCPGGTSHFDCNGAGRCDCTSSMGCARDQTCRNVGSQPAFCIYP